MNPYKVVKDFEKALCDYTGAPYAVTVTSCTMALLLACRWGAKKYIPEWPSHLLKPLDKPIFRIPKKTYISVPQSVILAGGRVEFADNYQFTLNSEFALELDPNAPDWTGFYELQPWHIYDSARYFSSDMFNRVTWTANDEKAYVCCSFHWTKTLAIGQGGCILHDDPEADEWFRRMRFDGRTEGVAPKDDNIQEIGYHCYMSPRDAAEGLSRLAVLPKHNDPLSNDDYPDLSKMEVFK